MTFNVKTTLILIKPIMFHAKYLFYYIFSIYLFYVFNKLFIIYLIIAIIKIILHGYHLYLRWNISLIHL